MGNLQKIKGGMEAKKGGGCVPKKGNVWSETLPVPLLSALETAFSMIACIFRQAGNLQRQRRTFFSTPPFPVL